MAFTCPQCGRTSYHPEDEKQGYCGNCHKFTDQDGESRVARNTVEEAADAGIEATKAKLAEHGFKVDKMFVLVSSTIPDGERGVVSAGYGFIDGKDMLADVIAHAKLAATQLGLELHIGLSKRPIRRG